MKKDLIIKPPEEVPDKGDDDNLLEYPLYPDNEDIYNKFKKEIDIDPEDIPNVKKLSRSDKAWINAENEFHDNESGSDLDIPGSELDDEQENIGNEDEENNYYSIGGDDHNDLD